MRIRIIRVSGKEYVQIVEDVKGVDGRWTLKVIESFGLATPENITRAERWLESLTKHSREVGAPREIVNATPLETCLNLIERRLRAFEETTNNPLPILPRLQYGLFLMGWFTLKEQIEIYEQTKDERILTRLVYITQPHLTTKEEIERFVSWLKTKPPHEKFEILTRRWSYK